MSNRSSHAAMEHNGQADKASCLEACFVKQRKAFSCNLLYPLVSGSAKGTVMQIRRTAWPLAKIGKSKAVKLQFCRAEGIFANYCIYETLQT